MLRLVAASAARTRSVRALATRAGLVDASGNPIRPRAPAAPAAPRAPSSAAAPAGGAKPAAAAPAGAAPAGAAAAAAQPGQLPAGIVVEVTDVPTFQQYVAQSPVGTIVAVWAPWSEESKALVGRLQAIAGAAKGAIRVALINADTPGAAQLLPALQVRSVPTLLGLAGGALADSITGPVVEARFKQFITKLLDAAEAAGLGKNSAVVGATDPFAQVEGALGQVNTLLDEGDVASAVSVCRQLSDMLNQFRERIAAAEAADDEAAKAAGKPVPARNPMVGPLADVDTLIGRTIAALIRGYAALASQAAASGSSAEGGAAAAAAPAGTPSDPQALLSEAEALASYLRSNAGTRFRKALQRDDVTRALAALDVAKGAAAAGGAGGSSAGAEGGETPLQALARRAAGEPGNLQLQLQLMEAHGPTQEGIDIALRVLKADAKGEAGAAAKAWVLKAFDSLGAGHPLVSAGRKQLSKLLFR